MTSPHDWTKRLNGIDWPQYQTAYGEATPVKSQLQRLRSDDEEEQMSASHDLWCGLCHQHVQIGSAALPALPFLIEFFESANDRLKVELLDIFLGLAITSNPNRIEQFAAALGNAPVRLHWIEEVRLGLIGILPLIIPLKKHTNQDIAMFATSIVDELAEGAKE